jgi:hypothetical protein
MRDKAARKMLEEVALRNAIAKFRAILKTKAVPRVGLFWIDTSGTMFVQSVSLRAAEDYGEFRVFGGSHYDLWRKAVRANPQWRDFEYEQVPRGRVVYRRDPKKPHFIVYMAKRILKFKGKVVSMFNLPSAYVRFDTADEHYEPV